MCVLSLIVRALLFPLVITLPINTTQFVLAALIFAFGICFYALTAPDAA
jgi:uncharacterized membrane protein